MARVLFILSIAIVLGASALAWVGIQFVNSEFPNVGKLSKLYPVVHYDRATRDWDVKLHKEMPVGWVSLANVSRVAVGAVIVSEDWAFYSHKGYDPNQIKEALIEDWEAGRFVRGASTITQQVVRNVFLSQDKNLWRKFKELVLAIRLESSVKKSRILEAYLNIAEWGEGIFGIGQASRHYFGKDPIHLTAKEGAFLAMLLPSPKRYSQSYRDKVLSNYARITVKSILTKMTQAKYITLEERDRELSLPLSFEDVAAQPSEETGESQLDQAL